METLENILTRDLQRTRETNRPLLGQRGVPEFPQMELDSIRKRVESRLAPQISRFFLGENEEDGQGKDLGFNIVLRTPRIQDLDALVGSRSGKIQFSLTCPPPGFSGTLPGREEASPTYQLLSTMIEAARSPSWHWVLSRSRSVQLGAPSVGLIFQGGYPTMNQHITAFRTSLPPGVEGADIWTAATLIAARKDAVQKIPVVPHGENPAGVFWVERDGEGLM